MSYPEQLSFIPPLKGAYIHIRHSILTKTQNLDGAARLLEYSIKGALAPNDLCLLNVSSLQHSLLTEYESTTIHRYTFNYQLKSRICLFIATLKMLDQGFEHNSDFSSGYTFYGSSQVITLSECEPLLEPITLTSSSHTGYHSVKDEAAPIYIQCPVLDSELPLPSLTKQISSKSDVFGYAMLAIASLGFAISDIFVRLAETRYKLPATSVLMVVAFIIASSAATYLATLTPFIRMVLELNKKQKRLIVCRGIVGAATSACLYSAFTYIPTGDATAIFFVGPAFTIFFSSILLGESVTLADILTAVVSITGAILISGGGGGSAENSVEQFSSHQHFIGCVFAFLAAILSSLVYVLIRSVVTSMHFMLPILSLGIGEFLMSLALGGGMSLSQMMENSTGVGMAIGAGVFAFIAQMFMQTGLRHCNAGSGSLIRNLEVPFVYTLGMLLLHEVPTLMKLFGSLLVVSAAGIIGVRQMLRKK